MQSVYGDGGLPDEDVTSKIATSTTYGLLTRHAGFAETLVGDASHPGNVRPPMEFGGEEYLFRFFARAKEWVNMTRTLS